MLMLCPDEVELEFLIGVLFKRIEVIPKYRYDKFLEETKKILPGHPKDVPYFALALSLNCAIWPNEKRFKKQPRIKVFSSDELKEFLSR